MAKKVTKKKIKMKTRKGVAKRFKLTGTGNVKRQHGYARHILTKKSANRKRKLKKSVIVSDFNAKKIKSMLH